MLEFHSHSNVTPSIIRIFPPAVYAGQVLLALGKAEVLQGVRGLGYHLVLFIFFGNILFYSLHIP